MGMIQLTNGARFNTDHYLNVVRARQAKGLPTYKDHMLPNNGECIDHPLLGKKFSYYDEETGETDHYVIEHVHRHWLCGWYYIALSAVNGTRSHGTQYVGNDNCVFPSVVEGFEEDQRMMKFYS